MHYCPYCSEPIKETMKTCPHCKRSLELELIKGKYRPDLESSKTDKKMERMLWFHTHRLFFYSFFTLVIGLVVGAVLTYGYAQASFASEREDYTLEIERLGTVIDTLKQAGNSTRSGFERQLAQKDELINLITKERNTMGRLIYFTRRMVRNSTIMPKNDAEVERFRNNFIYLQKEFDRLQETLKERNFSGNKTFNLKTIPQFLE